MLFYNYVRKVEPGVLPGSSIGVATATSPTGPFTVENVAITNARPVLASNHFGSMGDFDVFVDSDGAGYIVYSFGPMSIEALTTDFLNGTGINGALKLQLSQYNDTCGLRP